jgi:hypothetical protein
MTEGNTIQESLLELRKDIEQADGALDLKEKVEAVTAILGRIAGLLEGHWAAIQLLRASEEEADGLDEVEGPTATEQGTLD